MTSTDLKLDVFEQPSLPSHEKEYPNDVLHMVEDSPTVNIPTNEPSPALPLDTSPLPLPQEKQGEISDLQFDSATDGLFAPEIRIDVSAPPSSPPLPSLPVQLQKSENNFPDNIRQVSYSNQADVTSIQNDDEFCTELPRTNLAVEEDNTFKNSASKEKKKGREQDEEGAIDIRVIDTLPSGAPSQSTVSNNISVYLYTYNIMVFAFYFILFLFKFTVYALVRYEISSIYYHIRI